MTQRTIGDAAREAGVGVETIRFYERKGLISQPPKPRHNGYRSYSNEIVERIQFIRNAQALGFSLQEICELLALHADPNTDCNSVRTRASAKLEEVEQKMAQLRDIRSTLKKLISSCPQKGPAAGRCTILGTLSPEK